MAETSAGPAYRLLAERLRRQIADGDLPVGSALPSARELIKQYGGSTTVVRDALKILREEGLIYGHPGKAVYVQATPEEAASDRASLEEVAHGLSEVREQLASVGSAATDIAQVKKELSELRRSVAVLQSQLIELYGRVGQPYPHDKAPIKDQAAAPARKRAAGD
ncbi:GntR family transcriptional regulator [Streptomyces sp. 8N114]|uniref:GntR family transcriptional regulator n=1 Tax=Streptomyces sp. 8N114 TaxID=3457419 RepID=UPI003FD527DE